MNRLNIIETMAKLEMRKKNFENLLHNIKDQYYDSINIAAALDTNVYQSRIKYNGEKVECNFSLFLDYIKKEIKYIESEIKKTN